MHFKLLTMLEAQQEQQRAVQIAKAVQIMKRNPGEELRFENN